MSIGMLPVELLISVFEHLQEYETHPTNPDKRTRLSPQWLDIRLVCRHWRAIADDHSKLWSTIDVFASNHTLDWVNLCLSKSGIAELELRFHAPGLMPEVCNALLPHAGRVRSISASGLETVRGFYALRPLFLLNLPKLQELHLDENVSRTHRTFKTQFVLTELLGDLGATRLPALHTVALPGIFFPWESAILRNLRVLRLAYWEKYPGIFMASSKLPADRFLHALAACRRLEELSIDATNTDPRILQESATGRDLPTISLPNLRKLELKVSRFESRVLFVPLLAHIRFPAACSIALAGPTGKFDREPPAYAHFLPTDSPECFPVLANAVEATWHVPSAFSCKASATSPSPSAPSRSPHQSNTAAAGPEFRLALKDGRTEDRRSDLADPGPALAQFCEYFARAPTLAKLTLRTSVGAAAAYAHAFRRLPAGVAELEVEYPFAPGRDAVRGLLSSLALALGAGEPESPSGGAPVLLGGLRVLRLRGLGLGLGGYGYEGFDEDVAECVRSRRAAGACALEVEVDYRRRRH